MKTLQIKTAQNVNVEFNLANAGQRLSAFIIDNILKGAYILFILYNFDWQVFNSGNHQDGWSFRAIVVVLLLPVTFYTLASEILMDGQTIGKRMMKIRVINIEGFKPSITDYLIRWFLRLIDFNLFFLVYIYFVVLGISHRDELIDFVANLLKLTGLILILSTKNNQRFGDMIANTIVIQLNDKVEISQTILENISNTYTPTYPNVIRLSDNDARIIKDHFKKTSKAKHDHTLKKLRYKIIEVTGIKPEHKNDIDFIDTVLKDYNYYTQNM